MSGHAHYEAMLVCADELTLAERVRLEAHLAGCAACRGLEAIYAENRERLRGIAQARPPEEFRAAVLAAAESSRSVAGGVALLLPFTIIPVTLVLIALGVTYGAVAWIPIGLGLVAGTIATGWWIDRRQRQVLELPLVRESGTGLRDLARAVGWDTLGAVVGLGLLGLLLLVPALLGGH